MRPRLLAPVALALAASGAHGAPAYAQSGDTCVAAYEGAQELRQRGALVEARRELDVCRAACPAALARDCDGWQRDVAARLGRVRLVVRRDGTPAVPDRVLVDGRPAEIEADGTLVVDPGVRVLRVEAAGAPSATREVSLPPGGAVSVPIDLTASAPTETPTWSPSPPALIVGGVGVGALIVGGGLGIAGHVRVGDLEEGCAPECPESEVDAVRAMWIAGGVAAGVGVAALAVAVALGLGGPGDGAAASTTGLVLAGPPAGAPLGVGARATF